MACFGKLAKNALWAAAACLIIPGLLHHFPDQSHAVRSGVAWASEKPVSKNVEFERFLKDLRGDDAYAKHRAVIALGKSGNSAATDPLIAALGDSDPMVRSFAAVALGALKDRKALDPLIRSLKDSNDRVRRSAAEALGALRYAEALQPLVGALKDASVFVRRSAAQALGVLGNPQAVDPLIEMLSEEDDFIWNGAANALTVIGTSGIPQLVAALGHWTTGPRAAKILKELNWTPSSEEERIRLDVAARNRKALMQNWETTQKWLLRDMNSGNAAQSENAVYALIGIGREECLNDLEKRLQSQGNPDLARIFLQSGNPRLAAMARAWAAEKGKVIPPSGASAVIQWGGM